MADETQAELNRMLLEYAQLGKAGLAQMMLDKGAHLDAVDERGRNALHLSALLQHPEFVIWALGKEKIKIDATDSAGETPLVKAVSERVKFAESMKSLTALIDKGAKVNFENPKNGATALMAAATSNNVLGIRLLLQKGANIDARDDSRESALMKAACGNNMGAIGDLIAAGADPLLTNRKGKSAADIAGAAEAFAAARLLKAYEDSWRRTKWAVIVEEVAQEYCSGLRSAIRPMKPLGFRKPGA